MSRRPIVDQSYQFDLGWQTLVSLVDTGTRMAGHDGERAAMDILTDTFDRAGLEDVGVESVEIPAWFRGESAVTLPGRDRTFDGSHEVIGLPGTPAGEETAPLVDLGHGTPAEFDAAEVAGKVVIASSGTPEDYDRWFHRREKYDNAAERGAVGFLFRNHVPGCLPPTGDIGDESGEGSIPAAGVSRELGRRLVRYCEDGPIEAKLDVEARVEETTSGNVVGRLGPDTEREILVSAHHDAHDIAEGARDNGSGCAIVVGVAAMLAPLADELDTGIRFVTFGAEEIGLRGSRQMVETVDLGGIAAVFNCDAIGSSRDLGVFTHGFDDLEAVFEAAGDALSVPIEIRDEVEPHSDHWPFVRRGVPGVMAHSAEESDDRGWGHTHGDTLDKVDRRDLRELAVPIAEAVYRAATGEYDFEHVSPETIVERAEAEGYDLS